jgi:hypothetical protein
MEIEEMGQNHFIILYSNFANYNKFALLGLLPHLGGVCLSQSGQGLPFL